MKPEFERELEALHPAAFGWAVSCCRFDRAEAEDVLQTVYLKILDGRARWDGRAALKTWLFAIVRLTAAERRRGRWLRDLLLRREPPPPPADPPSGEAIDAARVRASLASLPPRQREVLDLVFFHDMSVAGAAAVMGVGAGSARVHYDRAKKALAAALGEP